MVNVTPALARIMAAGGISMLLGRVQLLYRESDQTVFDFVRVCLFLAKL